MLAKNREEADRLQLLKNSDRLFDIIKANRAIKVIENPDADRLVFIFDKCKIGIKRVHTNTSVNTIHINYVTQYSFDVNAELQDLINAPDLKFYQFIFKINFEDGLAYSILSLETFVQKYFQKLKHFLTQAKKKWG